MVPALTRDFAPNALATAGKQEVSTVTAQPEVAGSSNGGLPASAQAAAQISAQASQTNIAPGSIVLVRDEEGDIVETLRTDQWPL